MLMVPTDVDTYVARYEPGEPIPGPMRNAPILSRYTTILWPLTYNTKYHNMIHPQIVSSGLVVEVFPVGQTCRNVDSI